MKFFLYLFCMVAFCTAPAKTQDIPPYFLGNNSTGTEFYFTFLASWPVPGGANNIKIYISSAVETDVIVEVKGKGYIKKQKTKPNNIIEFTLPPTVAQPYFKTDTDKPPVEQVYKQQAVHIIAKDPITVYGVTRYQYSSDAFLALPVSALGTEYIVASYADVANNTEQYLPSQTAIVAAFDNTKVRFTLGGTLTTQTVGGLQPGKSKDIVLNKGDVFHVSSLGEGADLSGSKIVADKPVGVVSGNFCAYVPVGTPSCDHLVEMEIPTHTWGKEYVVTKFFGRTKNSFVKIMAKEPNTQIYRNGEKIGVIQQAGGISGVGFLEMRVADGPADNFIISADKPISVTQFNIGQADDNVPSDPFQMVLTPTDHYVNEMVFTTPGMSDGSGFATNYVNIAFELDSTNTLPDDFAFGMTSAMTGEVKWETIVARFGSFFHAVPSSVGDKRYGIKVLKLPQDGVYSLRCSSKFSAYSYGFSSFDSYGYPAGASLRDISQVDARPPIPTYVQDGSGSESGNVVDKEEPWSSGLAKVFLLNSASTNYTFSVNEFLPGIDKSTTWELSAIDPYRPAKAVLIFTDRAGNDTTIVVEYNGKPVGVGEEQGSNSAFSLAPNPVLGTTVLQYNLVTAAPVRIALYDQLGKEVMLLADAMQDAGEKTLSIGTETLSAGVYFCRVSIGGVLSAKQVVVVK